MAAMVALCATIPPAFAQQTVLNPDGTSHIAYAASTNPSDWIPDRKEPAGKLTNVGEYEGRFNVLQYGIDPPSSPASFYNWQGYQTRTQAPAGNSFVGGDLWVNPDWRSGNGTDYVRTGLWGSAMPESAVNAGKYDNGKASMPIVSFTNKDGAGHFEVWDPGMNPDTGWIDLPNTANLVRYGGWNSIDMRLLPAQGKVEYYLNGTLIYTWANPAGDDGSLPGQFWAMYLNARNNGSTSFQTYWSDLMAGQLLEGGHNIGDTPGDVAIRSGPGTPGATVVSNGARIGGSVSAQGSMLAPSEINFAGNVDIAQNVKGDHASFAFSRAPGATTRIGGDVTLQASGAGGGTVANPIQVGGSVSVDDTSLMGGNWNVAGSLHNAGTVSPGNSIGVIGVGRNLVMTPDSTYQAELNAAGQSDRIDVAGTTSLAGGLSISSADGYKLGHPYTVLTSQGGFGGTMFDNGKVTWDRPDYVFIAPQLRYGPDAVTVTIDRNATPFASAAKTPNQAAAARGLDSLAFGNKAHDAVAQMTSTAEASRAFGQLSGEIHASAKSVLMEDSHFVRDTANERVRQSFAARSDGQARPADGNPVDTWVKGFGAWGDAHGKNGAAGVDTSTGGVLFGADTLIGDAWRAGLMGGYSRNTFNAGAVNSSGTSDNYHIGAYGGTQQGPIGLRGGAAYTWHNLDTNRSVGFAGYNDSLKGTYGGSTAQVFGEAGYKLDFGKAMVEPYAGLAYVNQRMNGFQEKGGDAALHGKSGSDHALFSTLGVRGSSDFEIGGQTLTATGGLGWRHAFGNVLPDSTLAFTAGGPFSVTGVPIARDSAVVEAGLSTDVAKNATVGVSYVGQMGGSSQSHGVNARFLYRF